MGASQGRSEVAASWPLAASVALLVLVNLLNNVVAPGWYLLWACLGVAGLVALAGADGLRRQDWGAGQVTTAAWVAAAGLITATAAVMVLGTVLLPSLFDDQRAEGMDAAQVAYAALVRAPLGTALLEEVAFRGVLLAMLAKRFGIIWAVAASSAAFGVWHVVPSLALATGNAALRTVLAGNSSAAVAAAVLGAALGGVALCLLRVRFGHLIAPLAVHTTGTSLGYLLAWRMAGG